MINIDSSIIWAIIIFLVLVAALNQLLFKPLMKVQAERESRTTGLISQTQENLNHHLSLFSEYQVSIKNARMEGYRRQDQVRAEAMKKRAELLAQARKSAEQAVGESRESIRSQVETAKQTLAMDAEEIARTITSNVLGRSAADAKSP